VEGLLEGRQKIGAVLAILQRTQGPAPSLAGPFIWNTILNHHWLKTPKTTSHSMNQIIDTFYQITLFKYPIEA
jgi:hypothetical protein